MSEQTSQPRQQQEPPGRTGETTPAPDHGEHSCAGSGKLTGKGAITTGSDSGIGRAVAIPFAREGADVLISYLVEDDDARETASWVEEAGRRAVLVPGAPVHVLPASDDGSHVSGARSAVTGGSPVL